jgi:regulator of protease activity HflC (stomatin/prohibitin superfamily)
MSGPGLAVLDRVSLEREGVGCIYASEPRAAGNGPGASSPPDQVGLRLAECARQAKQALADARRAHDGGDFDAFQRALERFMAALRDSECVREDL